MSHKVQSRNETEYAKKQLNCVSTAIPGFSESHVVYKFNCPGYQSGYIGNTDRILFIRTHEHTLSNIGAFLLLSGSDANPSQDETTHKVLFLERTITQSIKCNLSYLSSVSLTIPTARGIPAAA